MTARKIAPGQALTLEIYNDLVSSVQAIESANLQDALMGYKIKGVDRRINQIAIVADVVAKQWNPGSKEEAVTVKLGKMFKGSPVVTVSVKTKSDSDVPLIINLREVSAQEFKLKLHLPEEYQQLGKKRFNYELSYIAIGVERD